MGLAIHNVRALDVLLAFEKIERLKRAGWEITSTQCGLYAALTSDAGEMMCNKYFSHDTSLDEIIGYTTGFREAMFRKAMTASQKERRGDDIPVSGLPSYV